MGAIFIIAHCYYVDINFWPASWNIKIAGE